MEFIDRYSGGGEEARLSFPNEGKFTSFRTRTLNFGRPRKTFARCKVPHYFCLHSLFLASLDDSQVRNDIIRTGGEDSLGESTQPMPDTEDPDEDSLSGGIGGGGPSQPSQPKPWGKLVGDDGQETALYPLPIQD